MFKNVCESIQTSIRAQCLQMGKHNFAAIYQEAVLDLGERPRIKISFFCDQYRPDKDYAGLIVYSTNGNFRWRNERGVAKGHNGRAFYVMIKCTNDWPRRAFARAGQGTFTSLQLIHCSQFSAQSCQWTLSLVSCEILLCRIFSISFCAAAPLLFLLIHASSSVQCTVRRTTADEAHYST